MAPHELQLGGDDVLPPNSQLMTSYLLEANGGRLVTAETQVRAAVTPSEHVLHWNGRVVLTSERLQL
jgi:hypothetical protein